MKIRIIAVLLLALQVGLSNAQTGPGGVGNATGANSQPQNVLWLRANTGISSSGGLVDSWTDQSGSGNSATGSGATRPTFNAADANFNNLSSLTFPNTPAVNFYLQVPDNDNLDNSSALSFFFAARPTTTSGLMGLLSKRTSPGVNQSYWLSINSSNTWVTSIVSSGTLSISAAATTLNQSDVVSLLVNSTSVIGFQDGANQSTSVGTASFIPNNTSNLFIGSFDDAVGTVNNFEGQIAEVIMFRSAINAAQRQIIENYLSSKYSTTITGDLFLGDTPGNGNYDFDLVGIGQASGTQHILANSQGLILSPANGTLDTNGEFILAAHNGTTNAVSVANLGTSVQQRWARTWYIDKTPGTGIDANITFDFSEGISGQFPQNKDNYVLLKFDGTNYQIVAGVANADKTLVGDQITFKVTDANLTDGIYTLGTINSTSSPVNGTNNRTWYSYQSGNWTDPNSWTLDGGLFPLLVNPSSETPSTTDNVVITSGRTITMNTNNIQVNSVEVIGTLDLLSSTGHNFVTIKGSGRIKLAASTDNFPLGSATEFIDSSIGGTVEINGTGMVLNQARTLNNLEINLTNTTDLATLLSDVVLNGTLKVTQGIFKFNNDVASVNRNLTVYGNITVETTGAIRVGTTNNRHEFNVYGDFTNDGGTAYFTQRTSAITGSDATDGIVDFNLLSSSKDQSVNCNGVTRFYRIEITKGIDDTFKATINASAGANFNLFGRANYDINEVNAAANGNGSNLNALGLNSGTVEIGTNVDIPALNTVGNYAIYEGAQLWVNGGSVTKSSGTAIVPYGKVRVSSGTLTASVGSGLTIRENGVIQVDGGAVVAQAIRTSVTGSNAVGSYIQSGGTVTLTGGGVSADYAVFSLTYTGNVFNMSGGVLTVQNRSSLGTGNLRGAIFINSDPANTSVTGGTVIMDANNAVNYRVTSRASFWNVILRPTGGSRTIELLGTTSGSGGGANEPSVAIQPLIVLNDFSIESNATFTTNSANVTIAGNFEIQNGATYTYGTNTTTINGAGVSSLIFGNTAATQNFNNLTINKTNSTDEVVIATGRPSPAAAIQVNGVLNVLKGVFDYGSFIASAKSTVNLASAVTVGKIGNTGRILLDGASAQTINSSLSTVYNLEINNASNVTLATNNLTLLGTLTLTAGVFDINIFRLTIGSSASPTASISGAGFSATKMIRLAGSASDEGLELYLDANKTLLYPIGTSAAATPRYTPVTAVFQNFSDDGFVRMSLGDSDLATSNLGAGANTIISYYWRVQHSGFTVLPRVTSYTFNARDSDDPDAGATPASLVAGFVPGKVLDVSPFTRSSEVTGNISAFTITFNGNIGSGATPFTLENANYTAGTSTRFTGLPTVYYSRSAGATGFPGLDWHNGNNWSLTSHTGAAAGSFPTAGSIAIIGSGNTGANNHHSINVTSNNAVAAELIFVAVPAGTFQSRLTVQSNRNITFGRVSGPGTVMIRVTTTQQPIVTGDFGDFSLVTTSQYNYTSDQDAATPIILPTNPVVFPNLRFEGANTGGGTARRMTIPADIMVRRNLNVDQQANFVVSGNVTVLNNVLFNDGTPGRIELPSTGSNITFSIGQDLLLRAGAGTNNFVVGNGTPSSLQHRLIVGRNITIDNGNLTLFNGTGTANNAILEIGGTVDGVYTNSAGTNPSLFQLVMNKSTSVANTFTLSNNMILNGPFNQPIKPLILQNGLLILNNALIDYTLTSGGGDFNIPSSAGLEVRLGAASTSTTSSNANITLDGLLRVSGGSVNVNGGGASDTNYIEYSNSGSATIEVTGGTLTVAGQVRRGLSSTTGVLKYTQSAGTVLVANESATATSRGAFEVLNTGSQFNHTGGSFTLVRGTNSATVPSLWLEPASSTITGSTITIGNTSTPASQTIGIQSTVNLNDLTISGSNNPVASIYITPLTVNGNLTVSSSTTLNANNQNLTIGGNFTVDGSYVPTSNLTTFTNTGAAAISGVTPLFNFYNFTKTGAGVLTTSKDITINKDLILSAGTFATGAYTTTLKGNARVDATHTSTSGSGIVFSGSSQQQLTRSVSGTGTLGIITISNSLGVIIPDGNGYNFDVTSGLRLQQGVFDIGGSLLFLQTNANITPVNPFSATNMIQTNSSFTDKGVKKQFPANYVTDFTFPVGQLYYTPVIFNFSGSGNTSGTISSAITVRPANERHPSIVDDNGVGELPSPAAFNDLNNVLQYHWIINADNVSGLRSNMTLSYPQALVSVTAPYTEVDYIAARILSDANPTKLINKFSTAEVDETTNVITFTFSNVTDAGISAEYFAGVDVAIPDNVPVYTTTASGNVNGAIYTPVVPGGGAPRGATVIVNTGHTLTLDVASGSVSFYETQINAGATLTIPTGSIGHRLGTITGTGDLRIDSNTASAVMPAAVYDDFFSCAGGGLIFGGNGAYDILGGITSLRNLTLLGSNTKTIGNNDVTICNDLTLNGPTLNTNNRIITIQNDFNLILGIFNNTSSGGTLTITRDLTQTAGTFNGGNAATKTIGRNLTVNGGTFVPGSGTTNITRVNGNMTVAGAATISAGTTGATGQKFVFGGSSQQTLTGTFTGTRAFNRLEINNSAGLLLAGNTTINSQLQLTNGLITPGTNTFLLEASAVSSPTAGSATSFVNGKLYKVLSNGQSFTFPIGKSSPSLWRSGQVLAVSQTGSVTWDMEYFYAPATGAVAAAPAPRSNAVSNFTSADPLVLRIATGEYWRVSDGSSTSNGRTAKVGLSWGVESVVSANLAQRESMKVMTWNGTNWTNSGGTNFLPGASHTQARGTFESTATLSFSENIVTLGSTEVANALPVTLITFSARLDGSVANLYWRTASELNNDYFEIQHSADGLEFNSISKIMGKGTTTEASDYFFEDRKLVKGKNYYRLKQVDFDGATSYSKVISLNYDGSTPLGLYLYPNPTDIENINLEFINLLTDDVQIRIIDMSGRVIQLSTVQVQKREEILQIKNLDLKSGIYLVEVVHGNQRIVKRLLIK